MTTGTYVTPGGYPGYTDYYRKYWIGDDGKYEVDGRDKWNNYYVELLIESQQLGQDDYSAGVTCIAEPPAWTAQDEFRLQSRLVERIKGHKFNLAVDLAQANQLVKMCSNTIGTFSRALIALKRGNIRTAFLELGVDDRSKKLKSKDVSGRWLEMQYGWMPFLGSVHESAKAFEALSLDRSGRITASLTVKDLTEASCSPTLYTVPAIRYARRRIICELAEEVSFARSLGLLDPLSVAWELTPFSFVFDWFLPIGTYLENLSVIPSLNARFLVTTVLGYDSWFQRAINPAWEGTIRFGHFRRSSRRPMSSLTTQLPTFVDPITAMTYKRIGNAVSLAHQLLGA